MIESTEIVKAVHWIGNFRKRIMFMLIAVLAVIVGVFYFTDDLLTLLSAPVKGKPLFFMTPIEGIMTKLKLALFTGIVVAFPIILVFVVSILGTLIDKKKRLKLYLILIPTSTILLVGGILFGYKLILPTTVGFLISAGEGIMEPMLSGNNYVSFAAFLLLGVGTVFQLPLVMISLSRFGILSYRWLAGKRKISFFLTFIIMAILTPTPDAFTLLAVSVPVLLLYEASVWIIFILEKLDKKKKSDNLGDTDIETEEAE